MTAAQGTAIAPDLMDGPLFRLTREICGLRDPAENVDPAEQDAPVAETLETFLEGICPWDVDQKDRAQVLGLLLYETIADQPDQIAGWQEIAHSIVTDKMVADMVWAALERRSEGQPSYRFTQAIVQSAIAPIAYIEANVTVTPVLQVVLGKGKKQTVHSEEQLVATARNLLCIYEPEEADAAVESPFEEEPKAETEAVTAGSE